ncbi:unannotated protein [freshwater metagenome]|uniref:Unannotated protein n=1 Tax=freshwater metagenome TaxID=449393 RepID=A0A6J6YGV4_9ZZZZ
MAYSGVQMMTAAAPSEVAQMSRRRSGSETIGEPAKSSSVNSLRKRAFGFATPAFEFFTFTRAKSSTVSPNTSMRRRALSAKNAGFVAPSKWKRCQSGSSLRSPPTGAKKPLGVVSAPITMATSAKPARICARADCMACAPEAHAAYEEEICAPVQPIAWENVEPATKPG